MNARLIADLAFDVWRNSPRATQTRERLEELSLRYAESYFGPRTGWLGPVCDVAYDAVRFNVTRPESIRTLGTPTL